MRDLVCIVSTERAQRDGTQDWVGRECTANVKGQRSTVGGLRGGSPQEEHGVPTGGTVSGGSRRKPRKEFTRKRELRWAVEK